MKGKCVTQSYTFQDKKPAIFTQITIAIIMSSPMKTLIVGAGPGGLALAQMLRAQGKPYEIFERDAHPEARQQGWAVALVE